jgi:sortase (surface protein transpeptidase)
VGIVRKRQIRHKGGRRWAGGIAVAALGLALAATAFWMSVRPESAPAGALVAPAPELPVARTGAAPRQQRAIPVRISIPAIGVDARVIPLGLNRDHTVEVPKNFAETGWFKPGPEPGEQGAAVVLGHLASRRGPGVFIRLRELKPGAVIRIRLADRSTVRFVARSMIRVPKNRFPTNRVYARTPQPTLRLVTCAGALDPVTGHHPDNYIVFATLAR